MKRLNRSRKLYKEALIAILFAVSFSMCSFAGNVADNGTKVSFLSGLNVWDMSNLSSAEKGFLKFIVGIVNSGQDVNATTQEDMSNIGRGIKRGEFNAVMRKDMDLILNTICGNAYYDKLASGMQVQLYLDGSGDADSKQVTKVETIMNDSARQAINDANAGYKKVMQKLEVILPGEVGITAEDTQVEALRKINNWLCTSFIYDDNAFSYTVEQSLDTKHAVCGQISQIIKFSCDYLGIECELIADVQMVHAYNKVTLGGVDYYIDATWNNTNQMPERWFLLTREEFAVDHCV